MNHSISPNDYAKKAMVKEIFSSIQGEGLYVGEKQLFVRFCDCNLNCAYCDTDFSEGGSEEYDTKTLHSKILSFQEQTISFTGGEPLLQADFLLELLDIGFNQKIYLETNGILTEQLVKIVDKIDVIAMDIKLKSATDEVNRFSENELFLNVASKKNVFIKVVFDENIVNEEINKVCELAKKFNVEIILQPKMPISGCIDLEAIFDKFYSLHKNVRLIPQIHKFLNLK